MQGSEDTAAAAVRAAPRAVRVAVGRRRCNLAGAYFLRSYANAIGGAGGSGSTAGAGGNATATATGSTTSLTSSINATATVDATATGGTGSTTGTANASATANTANGQQATATSSADGTTDVGSTSAHTTFAGVVTGVTATTSTSGAGTLTGESGANIDGGFPGLEGTSFNAAAFASGLPNANVTTVIGANSNIAALLGSGNANAVILGYGTDSEFANTGGTQTLTSSDTFTLNATHVSGNFILGLAAPQGVTGFTSLSITTKVDGTTIAAGTMSFTTLASAESFFTDDGISLGAVSKINGATVQVTETLVTGTSGSDFENEFVLGATGGNGPPVFAGPASTIIGKSVATAIAGVSLSESGSQVGESYTVTLTDTHGLLALNQSGADVVTGSSSTDVTITGALTDIDNTLATLKDTDATAGSDTIALSATSAHGGAGTPFDIAVTVNGPPVILAPTSVGTSAGRPTAITGVSISETGNTSGESFTVVLS